MKQIFTLAACLLFLNNFSAVVSRNINYTLTSGSYNLDINQDGTTDFVITIAYNSGSGNVNCTVTAPSGDADVNPEDSTNYQVGSGAEWQNPMVMFSCGGAGYDGGLFTYGQHYMAMQFTANYNNYLAWLKVNQTSCTLVIESVGYNNTPDGTLLVGQTGATAVNDVNMGTIQINVINNNLFITGSAAYVDNRLSIYDLCGRQLLSVQLLNTSQTIPVNKTEAGIYLASLSLSNGQVVTRKIFVN